MKLLWTAKGYGVNWRSLHGPPHGYTSKQQFLLRKYDTLNVKAVLNTLMKSLFTDVRRGVLNLYKLADVLSHEVVAWTWCIVKLDKTQHSGTLDPADNVQVDEVWVLMQLHQNKEYHFCHVYVRFSIDTLWTKLSSAWGDAGNTSDEFSGTTFGILRLSFYLIDVGKLGCWSL